MLMAVDPGKTGALVRLDRTPDGLSVVDAAAWSIRASGGRDRIVLDWTVPNGSRGLVLYRARFDRWFQLGIHLAHNIASDGDLLVCEDAYISRKPGGGVAIRDPQATLTNVRNATETITPMLPIVMFGLCGYVHPNTWRAAVLREAGRGAVNRADWKAVAIESAPGLVTNFQEVSACLKLEGKRSEHLCEAIGVGVAAARAIDLSAPSSEDIASLAAKIRTTF